MSLENMIEEMQTLLTQAEHHVSKFRDGNASAGTRARVNMQDIKKMAQAIRVEIQTIKNNKL